LKQTRQKIKEAYDTEFAATIERAEKQILLARHGRRLLNLIDDTPVVPGDARAPFEYGPQARQVLNDAEDDLKDWQLELDDLPQIDNTGAQQHKGGEGSVEGGDTAAAHKNTEVQRTGGSTADGSRISSGTSIVTGAADQTYSSSEAPTTIPA